MFYLFVYVYGTHLVRTETSLKELVLLFHAALSTFTCCSNITFSCLNEVQHTLLFTVLII